MLAGQCEWVVPRLKPFRHLRPDPWTTEAEQAKVKAKEKEAAFVTCKLQ